MTRKLFVLTNLFMIVVLLLGSQVVTASAANHTITRISKGWNGSQTDGSSNRPAISENGRYVVFDSNAGNLVKGGVPGNRNIYLYDQQTHKTGLIFDGANGTPNPFKSSSPTISPDGRYVYFESNSTKIAGSVGWQIFRYDRKTGKTILVAVPFIGTRPDGDSSGASTSETGRYVAFMSWASNLVPGDQNQLPDIFVKDMSQNKISLVTISSTGDKSNGFSSTASISSDGRYVAFSSNATNLVPDDTNNMEDVFVHDLKTGTTERISVSSTGQQTNDNSESPAISGDGRYVGFVSLATNLVPGDTNGVVDVFVHDRRTGITERVSVSSSGQQQAFGGLNYSGGYDKVSLSATGRYVTFVSQATNFVDGVAINPCNNKIWPVDRPCENIYLRDRQTGKTSIVSISKSNKSGNDDSYSPSLSQNGQWIVFASDASNLVNGDTNGQSDIFVYHR
jgi:Tol biopolymer transport system component